MTAAISNRRDVGPIQAEPGAPAPETLAPTPQTPASADSYARASPTRLDFSGRAADREAPFLSALAPSANAAPAPTPRLVESSAALLHAALFATVGNAPELAKAFETAAVVLAPEAAHGLRSALPADATTADRWVLGYYSANGNDLVGKGFNELCDDNGFTASERLGISLRRGDTRWSVEGLYQLLTEHGGPRRWDELRAVLAVDKEVTVAGDTKLTFGPRLGVAFGGNAGGALVQDAMHGSGIMAGRRLNPLPGDPALQSVYPGSDRYGALIGGQVRLEDPDLMSHILASRLERVRLSGAVTLDGQAAIGRTGLTYGRITAETELETRVGSVRPFIGYAASVVTANTADPNLRQYYKVGKPYLTQTVSAGVRRGAWEVKMALDTNMGGSRQWVGTLSLGYNY